MGISEEANMLHGDTTPIGEEDAPLDADFNTDSAAENEDSFRRSGSGKRKKGHMVDADLDAKQFRSRRRFIICSGIACSLALVGFLACMSSGSAGAAGANAGLLSPQLRGPPPPPPIAPKTVAAPLVRVMGDQQMREITTNPTAPLPTPSCDEDSPHCPIASLFYNQELRQAATECIMNVGDNLVKDKDKASLEETVMVAVADGLDDVYRQLQMRSPHEIAKLDAVKLSKDERTAIIKSMALMCNEDVQRLGRMVTDAIRGSDAGDARPIKERIERELLVEAPKIRGFAEGLVPGLLNTFWDQRQHWRLTLAEENVAVMTAHEQGGILAPLRASIKDLFLEDLELHVEAADVGGAVLEFSRAMLDQMYLAAHLVGKEVRVPPWVTSLGWLHVKDVELDYADLESCELHPDKVVDVNFMKAIFCPFKYGSQGLDVLAAAGRLSQLHEEKFGREEPAYPDEPEDHADNWGGPEGAELPIAPLEVGPPKPPARAPVVDGCTYQHEATCPARDLFTSSAMFEVGSDMIMWVGRNLLGAGERDAVRQQVAEGFASVSRALQEKEPDLAAEMSKLRISEADRNALIACLELIKDARVQSLGYDVAQAMREAETSEPAEVRSRIEAKLRPRIPEIQQLRDTLVPMLFRKVWGKQHLWSLTLDPENIHVMQSRHGGKLVPLSPSQQHLFLEDMNLHVTETQDVLAAVLEEARTLLDLVKLNARLQGTELDVPAWATSLRVVDGLQSRSAGGRQQWLSCELDTNREHQQNFVKALLCPLKYGAQGLDALAAGGTFPAPPAKPSGEELCPAEVLLNSPKTRRLVTDNVMQVAHNLFSERQRLAVQSSAATVLAYVSGCLRSGMAEVSDQFVGLEFTEEAQDAVFGLLAALHNPEVQRIGFLVATALRQSTSSEPEYLRRAVSEMLEPHREEIVRLRDELVPDAFQKVWGLQEQWTLTLDPENIQMMQSSSGGELVPLNVTLEHVHLHDLDVQVAEHDVEGGCLEVVRALLEIIKLSAESVGKEFAAPNWVTSLHSIDTLPYNSFTSDLVSCDIDTHSDTTVNFMKALICPLKYGTQGLEAMKAAGVMTNELRVFTSCTYSDISLCPARELFVNSEVRNAVAENLMLVGKHLLRATDREVIVGSVESGFLEIVGHLRLAAPKVLEDLGDVQFSSEQKDTLVSCLRAIGDPRVQRVGRMVSAAIYESEFQDQEALKQSIVKKLRPHLLELQALRDAVVPKWLRNMWDTRELWALSLDPENVKFMVHTHPEKMAPLQADLHDIFLHDVRLGVSQADLLNGVLEHGRVLLDFIQFCARLFGAEMELPQGATVVAASTKGQAHLDATETNCELDVDADAEINFVKAMVCPLKLGSQGLDALAAVESMIGMEVQQVHHGYKCSYAQNASCPARELLVSPHLHQEVQKNIMAAGQRLIRSVDADVVMATVQLVLTNVSMQMQKLSPLVASRLSAVNLVREQRDAMLDFLQLVRDHRVQAVGYEVAKAIRACHTSEVQDVRWAIEKKVQFHREVLVTMYNELVPASLRGLWGSKQLFSLALDEGNIQTMQAHHGGRLVPVNVTMLDIFLHDVQLHTTVQDVMLPALEEGRVVVEMMMQFATANFEEKVEVPREAMFMVSTMMSDASPGLSCELDTNSSHDENFARAVTCPLKYGAQGLEALAAAAVLAEEGKGKAAELSSIHG